VLAPEKSTRRFSDVSALVARGDGSFDAVVDPEWTILGKPNGGYLLAMMGRAAGEVGEHPHPVAASAHYLRSPDPGPVVIEAAVIRAGRTASQVTTTLLQDGRPCVVALMTTARLRPDEATAWAGGLPSRMGTPRQDCIPLPPALPTGQRVALLDQIEIRLEPESAGFRSGRPRGVGELRGWLSLLDGEPFDALSLIFAVDSFPPATFDVAFSGWVPTFELTVYVRALPVAGPVEVLQRAQLVEADRVDESCFVWDATGRLVAQGTQLAGIRFDSPPL
jgi:acyl-coenzyme A thioesterase PaaI-like protein